MVEYNDSLVACIVIYNTSIDDSPSFKSLYEQLENSQIFIFDNSSRNDIADRNATISSNYKVNYQRTSNVGLGHTYNFAIGVVKNYCEYIGFFDQDTFIPKDYISVVSDQVRNNRNIADVFVPYVMANGVMISPVFKKKSLIRKREPEVRSAINSGMFVRMTVFDMIEFDDNLFLDYVDHDFFNKINFNQNIVSVLPSTIDQNFSDNEKNLSKALKRFTSYWGDTKEYSKVYGTLVYITAFKHALKLTIKYRNSDFFKKVVFNEKD